MDYRGWNTSAPVRSLGLFGVETPGGLIHLATAVELVKSPHRGKYFPICQGSYEEKGFEGYFHPTAAANFGAALRFAETTPITVLTCQACVDLAVLEELEEEYYCSVCQDFHIPQDEIPSWVTKTYSESC